MGKWNSNMSNAGDEPGDWHTGTRPHTLFGVGAMPAMLTRLYLSSLS